MIQVYEKTKHCSFIKIKKKDSGSIFIHRPRNIILPLALGNTESKVKGTGRWTPCWPSQTLVSH